MSENISEIKETEKKKMEEEVSSANDQNHNWVAGIVLIAIGVIFLFANLTNFSLDNWWALFILIPALTNFGNAWRSYQKYGHLTRSARGSFIGGLILTLIASAFLFNLDWGLIWPVFLIIGGIGALLGNWFN